MGPAAPDSKSIQPPTSDGIWRYCSNSFEGRVVSNKKAQAQEHRHCGRVEVYPPSETDQARDRRGEGDLMPIDVVVQGIETVSVVPDYQILSAPSPLGKDTLGLVWRWPCERIAQGTVCFAPVNEALSSAS